MPRNEPEPWRPAGLWRWRDIVAPMTRWNSAEVMPGCEVRAHLSWDRVDVGPPAKHRRDQATRFVAVLDVTVWRDGNPVASSRLPIEELAVDPDPSTFRS